MRKEEYELAIAVAELNEAIEFIIDLPDHSPEEIVEKVAEKDPSFVEHVRTMGERPKSALEFWVRFGIWSISGLRNKYSHIWYEVAKAYWKSDLAKKTGARIKLKTQINQILKDAGFK